MTSSADFKQAIRSGKISEAFLVAMSNIPELQITTKIVSDRPENGDRSTPETDNHLHTHISLSEGKIENEIGEKFTGDRYAEIKQFHLEQVTQAHQTIQQNLISLQKMFQLMSAFQEQVAEHPNMINIATDTSPALSTEPKSSRRHSNSANVLTNGHPQAYAERYPLGPSFAEPFGSDRRQDDWQRERVARGVRVTEIAKKASPEAATSALKSNIEPQLPAFDSDNLVKDLLLMTDDEDLGSETNIVREDWSEWLDEEDEVKTTVFEFKTFPDLREDKDGQDRTPDEEKERSLEKASVD